MAKHAKNSNKTVSNQPKYTSARAKQLNLPARKHATDKQTAALNKGAPKPAVVNALLKKTPGFPGLTSH